MIDLLDILTKDRKLPEGCEEWGIRSVKPDFTPSRGYRWPFPGNWAESSGPHETDNPSPCPSTNGDGICLAYNWTGMASGGIPAHTLLLCAYRSCDVLGRDRNKVRLVKAFVAEVIDGCDLLTKYGAGADLSRAYLTGADLTGADLTGADLTGADLSRADLSRAYLTGAYLSQADLTGADLTGADLTGADLTGADLSRADLSRAYLTGAYLSQADLTGADLTGADLSRVKHDKYTIWPEGFESP